MPNPVARAFKSTDNPTAALVLLRLSHWYRIARREGRTHTAQSNSDLMRDTGLTERQVTWSLNLLLDRSLIEKKRDHFGGRYVNHYKLTPRGEHYMYVGVDPDMGVGLDTDTHVGSYIQESQTGKSDMKDTGAHPHSEGNSGCVTEEVFEGDGLVAKAHEILATTKWKGKIKHKPDSASELSYAWKNSMAEVYDEVMVHLTGEQVGKLKHIIPKVGEGNAAKVIDWTIRHWIEFVKTVETEAGIKTTPSKPHVTFFLKHAAIAASLWAQSEKPVPKKQEALAGVQSGKSVQLISHPKIEDKPQSFEELMAILGDEDE